MKFLFSGFFFISILLIYHSLLVSQNIEKVIIESNTSSSFRALSVVDDTIAWVSGSNGWIGRTKNGGMNWEFDKVRLFEEMDFRTLYAFDFLNAIIANAGSPAYILRTIDGGMTWLPVYQNSDPEIFIDGIDFWNDLEGIIYGDPINGRMTLLKTSDGGYSWESISETARPKMDKGEASFAASGTGIRCVSSNDLYISSGGKRSRLFYSADKGNSWKTIETPIIQGEPSEGIYSLALSSKNMVIIGGDFTKEDASIKSVFFSTNGGKKWKNPKVPTNGYRECVEFIDENTLIATGPSGTDISYDGGKAWELLHEAEGMHVVRKARNGNLIILAGRDGKLLVGKLQ